jgi:hypothetical protein
MLHLEEGFNVGVELGPTMTEASVIQKKDLKQAPGAGRVFKSIFA